ncbi:MAG: hypothetical protein NDJ90_00065 [Oligoflexia bacterium]|nr:hypothetical protein [Oligoflexia bacterium]
MRVALRVGISVLAVPLLVIALIFSQAAVNLRLKSLDSALVLRQSGDEPAVQKWDPRIFRVLSFGFLPVWIDWHWIGTLLDPSMSRLPRGIHAPLYYSLDLVTELDPAFFEAYYTGSHLLAVIRDDSVGARDLLLKAERFRKEQLPDQPGWFRDQHWNGAWYLSLTLAYIYLFELDDMPRAAEAFQEAARQPGAPDYLDRLAERLSKPGGQYEVGLRLLNFMIRSQTELKIRQKLEQKREWLYRSQFVFDLNRAYAEFRGSSSRSRGPAAAWAQFRTEMNVAPVDPWGGRLSLDPDGRIVTTTPYEKVFGIE